MAPSRRPAQPDGHLRGWWLIVVCWAWLAAAGCEMQPQGGGEGPGRRQQELALTPEQELALGEQAYREVLSEARGRILPADRPEVRQVRQIATRLVKAAGIEPLQREINLHLEGYRFEWEANVIRDRQINAFCLPGGKIVVFTGLLPVAQDDDQLATVLSHEIAHALAHHASERVARERSASRGGILSKAYDRQQETEADHIGLFLMTFAGYDPQEAVRFWQRMQQAHAGGSSVPEILSDHPSDERRIRAIQDWIEPARKAKIAFDQGRIAPPRRR